MSAIILPFEENKHVKDLMEIFLKNNMREDAKGLAEVVSCISSMERDINKAIGELTAMRKDLFDMREEQKHPVKNMLVKAIDSVLARLKAIQRHIIALKDKIIGTCKQTVEAVKDQGIIAANGIVGALNVKGDLEAIKININRDTAYCEKQIGKIKQASKQFHTAGLAVRNFGRALVGKEPLTNIKQNGKLAQFIAKPFENEIKYQKRCLVRIDKSLAQIGKLEKAAELSAERSRPSIHADMKRVGEEIVRAKLDAPKQEKVKTADQSL